jgi:hypothetical protein
VLYAFFDKVKRVNLGTLFLFVNVVAFVLAIYLTGADKSWLFFLLFIRPADQANTNFRRALAFAHLSVALYAVLLLELTFVEHRRVAVRLDPMEQTLTDVNLHFTVTDTGVGIPHDRQSAIFEAFTQADGSTTRRYGGTGLGLTISRTLADMMGGRIWLEREPGQGTTFHFTARVGLDESGAAAIRPVLA